jgi:hypothetical protein
MFDSNNPMVFGLVIMIAARSSLQRAFTASTVRMPSGPILTGTVRRPERVHEAGLVPCAVSGMSTVRRSLPLSRW